MISMAFRRRGRRRRSFRRRGSVRRMRIGRRL